MRTSVVVPPTSEPVSVSALKSHLRVLHDTEDAVIATLGTVAREHIETVTGRAIADRTLDVWLPAWPAGRELDLQPVPIATVIGVYYLDAGGDEQTLAADAYHVVADAFRAKVVLVSGASWPVAMTSPFAVRVRFVAGHGEAVPAALLHAIKLLTEHFYYRRGVTSEQRLEHVPMSVDALCSPYKTFGWI